MTVRILQSFDKSKFDVNATSLMGITLALDNTLWACDTNTSTIYNLTQKGAQLSKFLTTSTDAGAISPTGVSQDKDGSLWWSESALGKIFNTDTSGNLNSSFLVSGIDANALLVQDVSYSTFDDTLWLCDSVSGKVYNATKTGTKISEFLVSKIDPNATNINGVSALDDGTLLLCDPSVSKVLHVKSDGTLISSHLTSQWSSNDPNGISGSNEREFWVVDSVTDTIYNIQTSTADIRITTTIDNALFDWVSGASGISFFWDRQNVIRPNLPYGVLNILSGPNKEGIPAFKYNKLDTYTYLYKKTFTLSVNVIADTQYLKIMSDIVDSLDDPSFLNNLRIAGLAYRGNSDVFNISELLNEKFIQRASVDIFFAYGQNKDIVPGEIKRIKGSGTIENVIVNFDKTV